MAVELDKAKIIHHYTVEKQSAAQIGVEVGVSATTILDHLKKWEIPRRPASQGKRRRDLDGAIDDIVSLYLDNKRTLTEIANLYKVSAPTIRNRLMDAGVRIRPNGILANRKAQYIASLDPREVEKVYNLGKPLLETSRHLGISVPTLRKILIENGIRIRSPAEQRLMRYRKPEPEIIEVDVPDGTFEERVKHLRDQEGLLIDQIAEVLGTERLAVYQCMNAWNGKE